MKGILVFNSLNDVTYIYSDDSFRSHVYDQALKQGIVEVITILKSLV